MPIPPFPRDPDRIALLSDLHIAANPAKTERGVNLAEHVRRVVRDVVTPVEGRLPDRVIVNGDLAHHAGHRNDYIHSRVLLRPIREAGLPLHIAMGNHDHRRRFLQTFDVPRMGGGIDFTRIGRRLVLTVPTRHADLILLDTLLTHATPGGLGPAQCDWLVRTLDEPARAARPVIVLLHHNPEVRLELEHVRGNGIGDAETKTLLDILLPRRQVKALFWGHMHRWEQGELEGLHLACLPAVAFVFRQGQPSGWIDCRLSRQGATLRLCALDQDHPRHGEVVSLPWRR